MLGFITMINFFSAYRWNIFTGKSICGVRNKHTSLEKNIISVI